MKDRKKKNRKHPQFYNKLIVMLLALILFVSILFLPQFRLSKIKINGCRVLTTDSIIEIAGLKQGEHIFKGINGSLYEIFNLRHANQEQILKNYFPYLRNAQIKSVFPSTIEITIQERIEVAHLAITDGFIVIDASGIALELIDEQKEESMAIPVIEGVQVYEVQLGEKIDVDMDEYLNQAVILLNSIINADKDVRVDVQLLSSIHSIRPVKDKILYVTMELPGNEEMLIIRIKNSDRTMDDLIWLKYAIDQDSFDNKTQGILDLTTSKRFITLD